MDIGATHRMNMHAYVCKRGPNLLKTCKYPYFFQRGSSAEQQCYQYIVSDLPTALQKIYD